MSKGFAHVIVEGGLGRDPESKATPSGAKVVNFSLGYERGFKDSVRTCWVNIVAFKDVAEFASQYLKKGKTVRVVGELDVRSWDDKETGKKRYVTEVVADKIQFVDSGSKSESAPATRAPAAPPVRQQATPAPRAQATENPFEDDDSIPF